MGMRFLDFEKYSTMINFFRNEILLQSTYYSLHIIFGYRGKVWDVLSLVHLNQC